MMHRLTAEFCAWYGSPDGDEDNDLQHEATMEAATFKHVM